MNQANHPQPKTIDVSVITTCYGRNRHLYNLLSSLANGSVQPAEVIIVNDDANPKRLAEYPLNIVQIPTSDSKESDLAAASQRGLLSDNENDAIEKTGFDTHYVGYGAEDTDFAFMARELNIEFYLTCDVIYHQQHSVYRPPLNHLSSIVINANRFYEKWQHWPMGGWLASFADMQLINWQPEQQSAITITRQPTDSEIKAAHRPDAPYV